MNRRATALLGLAAAAVLSWGGPASAIDIQKVTSPLGITAWLVEDQSIPLVSMSFAFEGGAAQDPADRPGVANMLSGLLDEGAGDLDSAAFQERLDRLSIGLSFDADPDTFRGALKTLTDNRAEATRLLRLALTEPRFDAEPVERTRAQLLISLKRGEKSPGRLAADAMRRAVFPDHPYGRAVQGTAESIAAIGVDDLRSFRQKTFARDNLKVAIVGAIDAGGAAAMLDEVFGGLPAKADLVPVPDVTPQSGKHIDIALSVPQALIRFSAPGIKEDDPDLIPAAVAAHILGGGSDSRLFRIVRGERGLAYSVSIGLDAYEHSGLVTGGTSTRADQSQAVIDLITGEIARFAHDGPTADELDKAKRYLIGSYPLRFVTSGGIAGQLLAMQIDGRPIDYVDHRNDLIAAVTIDDVRRAARRLFGGAAFTVVRVGPAQS